MQKYKIIAIMGKAGCGKDTLLKNVVSYMPHYFNALISCTTRPPRANEKEGRDYFFVTEEEFEAADLLEQTVFNNWHYGTVAHTLSSDKINIGVFSPDGVRNLIKRRDIELITIYLVANDKARLLRQLNREERPDVHEIVRRFGTDEADFADLSDITYTLLFNNSLEEFEAIVEYIANGLRAHWDN